MAAPSAETVDHLAALIGFDTTSRNSNLALIDWAAERLEGTGATLRYTHDPDHAKANLFASFGAGEGGVVLSGHTDVVPVDGQAWASDPFRGELRGGRMYGRGACDMKGFLAVVLAKAPAFAKAAPRLREPIHLALTYDEEVGCLGVRALLADLQQAGVRPSGCIVGEPTGMKVVAAHKGSRSYRCSVHGVAAHSSLTPQGLNAIEYAARLIVHVQHLAGREARTGERQDGYPVPFSTLSTNMISGGTGKNIVPALCEFVFDYRYLPSVAPDRFIDAVRAFAETELLPQMRACHPEAAIAFERLGAIPALDICDREEIVKLALALCGDHAPGRVTYGTEAPFFAAIGVPSIVCGPGDIAQAHKPDEYVDLDQLAACEGFMDRLVDRLAK